MPAGDVLLTQRRPGSSNIPCSGSQVFCMRPPLVVSWEAPHCVSELDSTSKNSSSRGRKLKYCADSLHADGHLSSALFLGGGGGGGGPGVKRGPLCRS